MKAIITRLAPVLALASVFALGNAQIYSQAPDGTGSSISQNDIGGLGNFATTYDNFELNSTDTIENVQWIGQYSAVSQAHLPDITGFTVNFYSDSSGSVGNLLESNYVAGTSNEELVSFDSNFNPLFLYSMDLPTVLPGETTPGFVATANTQYWMSIVADQTFPPFWGWSYSSDGDGQSYADFLGTRYPQSADLSFALFDSPQAVPEPTTYVAFGGAALIFARRRRSKKA